MTGCSSFVTRQSPAAAARPRSGFTIVELLVVVAIMAAMFGMILVGTRPSVSGEVRRAAQQLASVLLAAQSSGIGDPKGGAVVLELDTRSAAAGGPGDPGTQCVAIYTGDKPPFVVGTVGSGMPPEAAGATSGVVAITPTNGGDLAQGYRIQFFGSGSDPAGRALPASPWFGFQPAVPPATQPTVSLRTDAGQAIANTPWPVPVGGVLLARVACYPAQGPLAVAFPKAAAIDLRYSGTGDDPATVWGGLASKGDLAVSFDSVGAADALMQQVGAAAPAARQPVEPIYFLVAARTDIDANEALANDRSVWVGIQPQTGRVTVSANVPQTGTDATAVRDARANARAALAAGK